MAAITASLFAALGGVVDPMVGNRHFSYFSHPNIRGGEAEPPAEVTVSKP